MTARIYDIEGACPTVRTCGGGNLEPKILEPRTCAIRGRNPENPNESTVGAPTEQRLEIGGEMANTITTVQKDSMVVEPSILRKERNAYGKAIRKDYESGKIEERGAKMVDYVPRNDGISNTITTVTKGNYLAEPQDHIEVGKQIRVRKLTERECGRLMGVKDEDIDKLTKNLSKSAQYHCFGDSIITTVLMALFGKMFEIDYESKIKEITDSLCNHTNE